MEKICANCRHYEASRNPEICGRCTCFPPIGEIIDSRVSQYATCGQFRHSRRFWVRWWMWLTAMFAAKSEQQPVEQGV